MESVSRRRDRRERSRDRDRERHSHHAHSSRDKDRDRHHDHESRDRDYDYDEEYDRHRSRRRRHDDSTSRHSHSEDHERQDSRSREERRRHEDFGDEYECDYDREGSKSESDGPPSNTLMITNLPFDLDEPQFISSLPRHPVPESVRIVKHKVTGESRGFGFVSFPTQSDAIECLDKCKRGLEIGGRKCHVQYAIPLSSEQASHSHPQRAPKNDWICNKCDQLNFSRRSECFTCGALKDDECTEMPKADPGDAKRTTVVARGLSGSITEQLLWDLFGKFATVQSVRLMKERALGSGKGYCFVEYFREEDARNIVRRCIESPGEFYIHNEPIIVELARNKPSWASAASQGFTDRGPDPALESALSAGEYVSDPNSGFMYSMKTGYYYDESKKLFWDPHMCQYMIWDTSLGLYVPSAAANTVGSTNPDYTSGTVVERESVEKEKKVKEKEEKGDVSGGSVPVRIDIKEKEKEKEGDDGSGSGSGRISLNFKTKVNKSVLQRWTAKTREAHRSLEEDEKEKGKEKGEGSEEWERMQKFKAHKQALKQRMQNNPNFIALGVGGAKAHVDTDTNIDHDHTDAIPVPAPLDIDWSVYGADFDLLICKLCKRKLGSLDLLKKHLAKSKLHMESVVKEKARLEKEKGDGEGHLVDRAALRREMYGQSVNDPIREAKREKKMIIEEQRVQKMKAKEAAKEYWSSKGGEGEGGGVGVGEGSGVSSLNNSGLASSIGANMLKKMGWSAGEALGAPSSKGTDSQKKRNVEAPSTEVLKIEVRESGVGLGVLGNSHEHGDMLVPHAGDSEVVLKRKRVMRGLESGR